MPAATDAMPCYGQYAASHFGNMTMYMARFGACLLALALPLMSAACGNSTPPPRVGTDITGAMPSLEFHMTRANDGAEVSAKDYRGKIVLVYFGFTNCPDVCPLTLANLAEAVRKLGPKAKDVDILFVTVDPDRDTLPILKEYAAAFSPEMVGLRGTKNAIAVLARRYRVAYDVTPAKGNHPYTVNHSSAVFFFDEKGHARIVSTQTDDTQAIAANIEGLLP
jgi:protein SCO1/2